MVLTLADGTPVSSTRTGDAAPPKFTIDEGTLLPGVDTVLKSMKKGERATAVIQAVHAFGASGNAELHVPANAVIKADVELVDFVPEKESWDLKGADLLAAADRLRELGNDLFKKGDLQRALRRYAASVKFLESDYNLTDAADKAAGKLKKAAAHSNAAAVHLKLDQFVEARAAAAKAVEAEPNNVKALYRAGSACIGLGEFDDARKDLKRVLELDPGNAAATASLKTIAQAVAKQNAADKKRYGGMFDKIAKQEEAEERKAKAAAAASAPAAAPVAAAPTAAPDAAVPMTTSE